MQNLTPQKTFFIGIDSYLDRNAGFGKRFNPPLL
jgi:hypothetical protein